LLNLGQCNLLKKTLIGLQINLASGITLDAAITKTPKAAPAQRMKAEPVRSAAAKNN